MTIVRWMVAADSSVFATTGLNSKYHEVCYEKVMKSFNFSNVDEKGVYAMLCNSVAASACFLAQIAILAQSIDRIASMCTEQLDMSPFS